MKTNLENVKVDEQAYDLELGKQKYDLYNKVSRIRLVEKQNHRYKHYLEGNKEQESKFTKKELKNSIVDEIIFKGYLHKKGNHRIQHFFFKGRIKSGDIYLDIGFKYNSDWNKTYHLSTKDENKWHFHKPYVPSWTRVEVNTASFRTSHLSVLKKYSQLVDVLPYFTGLVEYWKSMVIIADCQAMKEIEEQSKKDKKEAI